MKNIVWLSLFILLTGTLYSQGAVTEEKKQEVQKRIDNTNEIIAKKGARWKAAITSISYLSEEEFKNISSGDLSVGENIGKSETNNQSDESKELNKTLVVPDWKSFMSPVENQQYDNCWAHAVTGVVEGKLHYYYGSNISVDLDEMDLTDRNNCGSGRNGGTPQCGFSFVQSGKIRSEQGLNAFPNYDHGYWTITSYSVQEPTSSSYIKTALANSPTYASMEVYSDFQNYGGGIYKHLTGSFLGYHAVVIVGYNDTEEYWICKNSWGPGWGEDNGYFRIAYGECGIDTRKCGTAIVGNQNCYAKLSPNLILNLNTVFTYSFISNEWAYAIGNTSLTGNISIPSSVTLLLNPGSNVNFSGYYIDATSGTFNIQNGITVQVNNGNRYYGLFNTIEPALNIAASGQTIMANYGNYTIANNATLASGAVLNIAAGSSIAFQAGKTLTINGAFSASNMMFDRSGSSGTWGGMVYNSGSSGSLSSCTIQNASTAITCNGGLSSISNCTIYGNGVGVKCNGVLPSITNCTVHVNNMGIWLNNVGSPTAHISGNEFSNHGMSGLGIMCYSSSPYIDGGGYIQNNSIGIFCVGSSPRISNTHVISNGIGANMLANSSATIGGFNLFDCNGTGINAEASYNVYSYYSDFYQSAGQYAVKATNSAQVIGQNNYWCPANSAYFSATNGALIFWQPGNAYPWTGFRKMSMPDNTTKPYTPEVVFNSKDSLSISIKQTLLDASKLISEKNSKEALNICAQKYKSTDDITAKKYLLGQIAECYRLAERKDFTDYLNAEIRQGLSADDELYGVTLELENLLLIPDHNYQKAVENLLTIKTRFSNNDVTYKNALFNLGYVYTELLSDAIKGKQYYDELKEKYPDDILTWQCKLMLGEIDGSQAISNPHGNLTGREIPEESNLFSNYPNPFNPSTTITYQIPVAGHISLRVYDMLGRDVAVLVDGMKEAGSYSTTFNADKFASGIYMVRLTAKSEDGSPYIKIIKMLLTK